MTHFGCLVEIESVRHVDVGWQTERSADVTNKISDVRERQLLTNGKCRSRLKSSKRAIIVVFDHSFISVQRMERKNLECTAGAA